MPHPTQADILLVEDDPHDAELVMSALAKTHSANGVHLVGDNSPRWPWLVRLDLKIRKLNGFDVLRQIEATPYASTAAVVIWTSSDEERHIMHAYRLGAKQLCPEADRSRPFLFHHFPTRILLAGDQPPWHEYNLRAKSIGITK